MAAMHWRWAGPGAVHLDIQAEALGGVGELHRCGDAHVLHVAAHEVGRAVDHEVDASLQSANVLGEEHRGDEQFPELAVRELRYASVRQRVLVPEVARLVAGPPDLDRVPEGVEGVVGVGHQVHVGSYAVSDRQDGLGLTPRLAVLPPVNLEGRIAQLLALLGEVGHLAGGLQLVVLGGVNAGRIGREGLAVAAQKLMDRSVVVLAGEVPEGDVDGRDADLSLLPHRLLYSRVDVLAFERVLPDEKLGDDAGPGVLDRPAPHVLTGYADVRGDRDGVRGVGNRLAGGVGRPVLATFEVGQLVGERLDFDFRDPGLGHRGSLWVRLIFPWLRRAGSAVR